MTTSTIFVATAPSEDAPGTVIITVQTKHGDVTTIAYQGRHPTHKSVIGTATLPTTLESLALQLAQNDYAWRETLLKEVVASTGRAPEDLVMVVQHVHDEQRVWFEPHDTRDRIADLEEHLRAVNAAAADWSRRAGAAERQRDEMREDWQRDQRGRGLRLAESQRKYEALQRQLTKLQAHLATPDFERLADMRTSEMTPAEHDGAREGWIRKHAGWLASDDHIEFLLRRIDALRNPPKD